MGVNKIHQFVLIFYSKVILIEFYIDFGVAATDEFFPLAECT